MHTIVYVCLALIASLLVFFLGMIYGGNLEKERFDKLYPNIGRLRVMGDSAVKLDFGTDLITLADEYTGARIRIEKGTDADYTSIIKDMDDEELLSTYKDAVESRDALKTDSIMAEAKKNKED